MHNEHFFTKASTTSVNYLYYLIIYIPHMDHQHIHIHTNFNNDIYARLTLTNCILKQLTHNTHLYIAVFWLKGKLAYT